MDEQSQKHLAEITAKEPQALTEAEIMFLRARRSYLSEREKDIFAELLAEAPQEEDESKPVKKAK